MTNFALDVDDLIPQETQFELASVKDRKFTICRWSLRVRTWATKKYGPERLREIFEKQIIEEIASIAWFMLKPEDKAFFDNSEENFLDNICSVRDQLAVGMSLLGAVGIGEPQLEKINEALKKKNVEPPPPTPTTETPEAAT